MSYLVLARKYRPSAFNSVSGQEHVTRTLANAIARNKVVHAYLFTGPRGVGKTSVARILAKALNCQTTDNPEPCQECIVCREVASGTSMAVREIDGASHNSVDNVRDLMDSFKVLPPPGYRNKVYIIDEVHMLSISAFNALLKSLEEPPPNTVFILATTDVHKIPQTVISRCQRHDFRALSVSVIEARLAEVCRQEGIEFEVEALTLVARLADGSMRDAQTLLDRVQTYCNGKVTAAEASKALGSVDRGALLNLAQKILKRDVEGVLVGVAALFETGSDPATLLKEFTNFWREVFIGKLGGEQRLRAIGLGPDSVAELISLVAGVEPMDLQDLWDLARDGADRCLRSAYPRYGFESLVVRMATRQPVAEIADLLGDLSLQMGAGREGSRPQPQPQHLVQQQQSSVRPAVLQRPGAPANAATSQEASAIAGSSAQVNSQEISWGRFLAFCAQNGGKILGENLRRLTPIRFELGYLEASGPDFTIGSINRDKDKLAQLMAAFSGGSKPAEGWRISLKKGEAKVSEVAEQAKSRAGKIEELESHPAIQSLQRVFPGSKVERVQIKDD